MFDQILKQLSKFIILDKNEEKIFLSKLIFKKYDKNELILKEGQICRYSYFINRGCFRYFYNVNSQENTGQFFFENGWYTDFSSFLTQNPTRQNIQALENSEILLLSSKSLNQLYSEIPKFERFGRLIAENAFLGIQKKSEMLENLTAKERYLNLIKERPKVFERIPQHYIASYLGIKPPSLSRIRRQISNKMIS